MTANPSTPKKAYRDQTHRWDLADALWGGTTTMRAAGETYLPQEAREEDDAYDARRDRTFLFNAFKRTVQNLIGKAFASSLVIKGPDGEPLPKDSLWDTWLNNVDLMGSKLSVFAQDLMVAAMKYGQAHILTDYPPVPPGSTLADEVQGMKARPYMILRIPRQLIGWRSEVTNGAERLTRVRLAEEVPEYTPGDWDDDGCRTQYRVLEIGKFTVYVEDDKSKAFEIIDSGVCMAGGKPLDYIPFRTAQLDPEAFMVSRSPLWDLMQLNVEHWQSSSDQNNILHVARVPFIFGKGFEEGDFDDDEGEGFSLGASRAVIVSNTNADMKFVEHGGQAITAGRESLQDLEDKLATYGAEPLAKRTGQPTATGAAIDSREAESPLAQWVAKIEDTINGALEDMALFAQLGDAPTVSLSRDFGIIGNLSDLAELFKLRQAREISRKAFFGELKRRGFIAEDYDEEADQLLLDAEGPSLEEMADEANAQAGIKPGEKPPGDDMMDDEKED